MLIEKDKKEALKALAAGKKVILLPESQTEETEGHWIDLDTVIGQGRFLVEVVATVDPEFEAAVQDMVQAGNTCPPPPLPTETEDKEVELPAGKSKKEIIEPLVKQGLSNKEISERTGIKYATVWTYTKELRNQEEAPENNTDRKLCKTCRFRGKKSGCDYISIAGRRRGCSVEDCNVYEKEGK